ncbi:MAG: hypothetical protein IKK50_06710 [Ruminiclostridium sp.]|nr:hypothetical protein [Ruminiclostridium sp.]
MDGVELKSLAINGVQVWTAAPPGRIPEEYQEVAYVQAAATVKAYINLGIKFDTKARVLMNACAMDKTTTAYPFGAAENSGVLRCMASIPANAAASIYGSKGNAYIITTVDFIPEEDTEYELVWEPGNLMASNKSEGETNKNVNQGSYTMTSDLYLFAQNYNGSPRFGGQRRISKFQYFDKTDTMVCDLVPCYRKSDMVVGMYDTVRKLFLTNAGSGAFTKGADV